MTLVYHPTARCCLVPEFSLLEGPIKRVYHVPVGMHSSICDCYARLMNLHEFDQLFETLSTNFNHS
jgi:hypothetical protein